MSDSCTLFIETAASNLSRFVPLFCSGVGVKARVGLPLLEMLCDGLGIDRQYLDQRVQTIFVNGRAVDRLESVVVVPSCVVALSAAMPGLVGATLRKGGLLAGFRAGITYATGEAQTVQGEETMVTLKLFNLVARELAGHLLERGVWVGADLLRSHFGRFDIHTLAGPGSIRWCDRIICGNDLKQIVWPDGWVLLEVRTIELTAPGADSTHPG